MSDEVLIKAESVSKKFCRNLKRSLMYGIKDIMDETTARARQPALRRDEFWALENVTFNLTRGECLGLIGPNGTGKTTLLKLINGLIKPDTGRITVRGKVAAIIALGAGFNPILSGRENILISASVLGISKREIIRKFDEIVDFADLHDAIDAPVQTYSSGMYVRLGFAVATMINPDVLLIDEVLAVGDADFRAKCLDRIGQIIKDTAVVFVSHNAAQIQRICNRVLYLEEGRTLFDGNAMMGLSKYMASTNRVSAQALIASDSIKSFECSLEQMVINYDEDLRLNFRIETSDTIETSLCLCNIADRSGDLCAQADFSKQLQTIPKGASEHAIRLRNIHLSADSYSINIGIFAENNKQTIAHARHCANFEVNGQMGYGPKYQLVANKLTSPSAHCVDVSHG